MRMKRNCEANMLVAVVTDAAFRCAMRFVAYLKSSEANTHDVHICGSVVVVVMGKVVLGSRMLCSDSESTARGQVVCDEGAVSSRNSSAQESAAPCLMTGSCLRRAAYVRPEYAVRCRQVGKVKWLDYS